MYLCVVTINTGGNVALNIVCSKTEKKAELPHKMGEACGMLLYGGINMRKTC